MRVGDDYKVNGEFKRGVVASAVTTRLTQRNRLVSPAPNHPPSNNGNIQILSSSLRFVWCLHRPLHECYQCCIAQVTNCGGLDDDRARGGYRARGSQLCIHRRSPCQFVSLSSQFCTSNMNIELSSIKRSQAFCTCRRQYTRRF